MQSNNQNIFNLENTLAEVHAKGITCRDELNLPCHKEIHDALWLAIQFFLNYCALRTKTTTRPDGTRKVGNRARVRLLVVEFGETLDGIQKDVLMKVFEKLDLLLAKPLEEQVGYIFCIATTCLISKLRRYNPSHYAKTVSLNRKVNQDGSELGELLPDTNSIEKDYEDKEEILKEIAALSSDPAMVLAHLARHHLELEPRIIEERMNEDGGIAFFAMVIKAVADKYHIPVNEIRACMTNGAIKGESLSTLDAAEISRLFYRAKKRLSKVLISDRKFE